jgi:hypothetical protein
VEIQPEAKFEANPDIDVVWLLVVGKATLKQTQWS